MAATTVGRESMTDGVTVWNVTRIGSAVYDRIDTVLAANITFGGLVGAEGFGVHNFSAGGTGGHVVAVRNTSVGSTSFSELRAGNDDSATLARFIATSSTYTPTGMLFASGLLIDCLGPGGLNLAASHASGPIRLATGGTQRYAIDSTGVHTYLNSSVTAVPLANGATGTPSLTFANDTDSGLWWSAPTSVPKVSMSVGGWEVARFEMWNTLQKPVLRVVGNGNSTDHCPRLHVERQSGGLTAPGVVALEAKNGTLYYLWVDTTGAVRVGTTEPNITNGDTVGTKVGTQT